MSECCAECKFSRREAGVPLRELPPIMCMRYPPQALTMPDGRSVAMRIVIPSVDANHWCGEYREKSKIEVVDAMAN